MYESTLLADALAVKSEIDTLLETRGYKTIEKFKKSKTIDSKLKKQMTDLSAKFVKAVNKIKDKNAN